MIPKVIHYCWFGKNKKPKLVKDCISSWKQYLADYEIIEWNEGNTDLSHPFVQEAYKLKKWAFVADYVRFKVLYEKGGIYLDTDMMLLKSLEDFRFNECFFGAEESEIISCGIIGAKKNNEFIKNCMVIYDSLEIYEGLNLVKIVVTRMITDLFRVKYEFYDVFDKIVNKSNIIIYPSIIFYPFPFNKKDDIKCYLNYVDENSCAVHLWSNSWIIQNEFNLLRKREYLKGFKIVINRFFSGNANLKYWRKVISSVNQSLLRNE